MKKLLTLGLLLTALTAQIHAASIVIQAGATPALLKSSGGTLFTTTNVTFGFFKGVTSTSNTTALSAALAGTTYEDRARIAQYLTDNFVPIGTGLNGLGTPAITFADATVGLESGKTVTGNITSVTFVASSATVLASSVNSSGLVAGTKLFAILADNAAVASSTQLAVVSGATWNSPGSASPSMNVVFGSVDTAGEVYRGSVGSIVYGAFVPEPTTSALFLIGAAVGLRRRR
jgi:hypothetical protein